MLLKKRTESDELLTMRCLDTRMQLTEKDKYRYANLERGYDGEVSFDELAKGYLQEERYVINDLLLEINNSYFQIDTLVISQGVIQLLDIKNYHGDFYLESDKLYAVKTGQEYKNPVNQLTRSTTLFRQLLQKFKLNFIVDAHVIFINPEFTLYLAPMDQPIILPTQVKRFLTDMNKIPSKLNDEHLKLARKLLSLHQAKYPYSTIPEFTYEQLRKGIYCKRCISLLSTIKNKDIVCEKCGEHEKIEHGVLRNVNEFKLLFPERKITAQNIYEWCNVDLNKRTISRVLKKNFTTIGNTKDTYYE